MKAEKKPRVGVWDYTEANEPTRVATVTFTDKGIAHIVTWVKENAPMCFNRVWLDEVASGLKWYLQTYHNGDSPSQRRHYEFPSFCTKSGNPEWLELELNEGHYTVEFEEV